MGEVRALADRYLNTVAELDPVRATRVGLPGHDHRLTDYSPDGLAAEADLARRTLSDLGSRRGPVRRPAPGLGLRRPGRHLGR